MTSQFFMIVLAVLLIAVSVFYGLKIIGTNKKKTASASWPVVNGHVLSKEVSSSKNSSSSGFTYRAHITYSYNAPGGPFEKKLFLGSKGVRSQAEKLLNAVGDTIQVHYNPEKPAEQISDYEKITPAQVITIIGSLILAVALIVLAFV